MKSTYFFRAKIAVNSKRQQRQMKFWIKVRFSPLLGAGIPTDSDPYAS